MSNYKHWEMQTDSDNIIWLGLNRKNATINTINNEVLDELNGLLQEVAHHNTAKGLVIHSLKAKGFIAGAYVKVIADFGNP